MKEENENAVFQEWCTTIGMQKDEIQSLSNDQIGILKNTYGFASFRASKALHQFIAAVKKAIKGA